MKNITLYWPIWAGYLVALLFMQSVMLWSNFQNGRYYEVYTTQMKFEDAISAISIPINGWLIVFAALIIAMALYSYIYNSKSANMIHALPVDKTQLFGTNVISGLVMLIVPQLITGIVSIGVCLSYGMTRLELIGIWLVESIAIAFIAFAFISCCAMFTGLLVALPIYVLVINFLPMWLFYMFNLVGTIYAYGAYNFGTRIQHMINVFLCPLNAITGYIGLEEVYENEVCVGMEVFAGKLLAVYVVVAMVMYVIAYFTYKKRHIEKAGEWITVEWLKPVFRFIAGMSLGIYGGLMIRVLLDQMGIILEGIGFVILMLLLGGFGYFLAEMLIRKNFHVFQKRNWIRCGVFSVILLLCFGVMLAAADVIEKYVPEQNDVEKVSVYMGYDIQLDGEEAQQIIEIHKKIIDNIDVIEERSESMNYEGSKYQYVSIAYELKNGDYIDRHYSLFSGKEEIDAIIEELTMLENNSETYLQNTLCPRYDEVTVFGDSCLEAMFKSSRVNLGANEYSYETIVFTPEQTKALYEAVIADIKAGTLMKHNVNSDWAEGDAKTISEIYLQLSFQDPDVNYSGSINMSENSMYDYKGEIIEYESSKTVYLKIGRDCEHVVSRLIEYGVDVDDIVWSAEKGEDLYLDVETP